MINYILLGHKNPKQIQRLIGKLYEETHFFYVYVHIDSNTDLNYIKTELSCFTNLFFLENEQRYPGTWGDLGIVMATIEALKQILKDKRTGYCVLLSGQDYPLKDKTYIEAFFKENYGTNFISVFPLPASFWLNSKQRVSYYKINMSSKRGDYVLFPSIYEKEFYSIETLRALKKIVTGAKFSVFFKLLKRRKFPNYLKPYGGDQWWALPIETVKKIIEFLDLHPDYVNYHKYSLVPDEMFFQSIFMALKEDGKVLLQQTPVTYVNWSRKGVVLPVTFTKDDFDELASLPNGKLFARKFDMEIDTEIFDLLDECKLAEKVA